MELTALQAPVTTTSAGPRGASTTTSQVAWVAKEELDLSGWVAAGRNLGRVGRCSQWWLGDWVRYGTSRWGEKYKEASRITGYDIQSLRNISWVAGRIDPSRRRDDLTWSHHAEVSALEPVEQDRWLEIASHEKMSVADLRIELRAARRHGEPTVESADGPRPGPSLVACPNCEHEFDPKRPGTDNAT